MTRFLARTSVFAVSMAFLGLAAAAPLPASAHTLKTDGSIEGVLHVSPGHLPTAGEAASFSFILKDRARKFEASNYLITLVVSDAQGVATTVPLTIDGSTAKGPHVFPHAGDYVATLTGSSTAPGIPSFRLVYDDISALPQGQHQGKIAELFGEHGGHLLLTGLIVLVFAGVVIQEKLAERRRRKSADKNP